MDLTIICAILLALLSGEASASSPVSEPGHRLALVITGMAAVVLFGRLSAGSTTLALRRNGADVRRLLKKFRRLKSLHTLLWLGSVAFIFYQLEWAAVVRGNWQLSDAFLVDELLILLPVVLPLVASWAVFYDVYRAISADVSQTPSSPHSLIGRGAYVVFLMRHHLGLILVPLLLVLAAHDGLRIGGSALAIGEPAGILLFWPVLAVALCLPWILRFVWQTDVLASGGLRGSAYRDFQADACLGSPDSCRRTGDMVSNAAVTGLLPMTRYVFLSDGLLNALGASQIAAVYAHELAHVFHRHLVLRVAAFLMPLAVWHAAGALLGDASYLFDEAETWLLALAFVGYLLTVFAWYCRQLELQADLTAARITSDAPADRDFSQGADRYLEMLASLEASATRPGVLHPSLERRAAFLKCAAADAAFARRFQRTMRYLAWFWTALLGTAAACWLIALLGLQN